MDDILSDVKPGHKKPVISMADHKEATQYAPLAQIESYWTSLRGNRPMPLRSEIDPRGLKGALEYCFVLERIAPGIARLRVAGSHLGDLMGMEVRGMPISSFLSPDSRQQFSEALEEVFETPATATVYLTAETSFGRPPMQARIQLMPVRSDLGDTSRILGGFVSVGDIGRVPRRFKVDMIKITPILTTPTETVSTDSPIPLPLSKDAFREAERARIRRGTDPKLPEFTQKEATRPTVAKEDQDRFKQVLPDVPYLRVVK